MYAVIESGGKQYRVNEGDVITVEKLSHQEGEQGGVRPGAARRRRYCQGWSTTGGWGQGYHPGRRSGAGQEDAVWKYKPKERYRRRQGHRQQYTRLRVEKIVA